MTISEVDDGFPILHMPAPKAALRHALPVAFEGVLGPLAAFYIGLFAGGLHAALATALCWAYGAVIRRVIRRERVSTVLALDIVLLTIRTAIAYVTGNAMVYFLQPLIWSVIVAGVLVGSAVVRRPFTQRFAQDFCALDPDVLARPRVQRFFVLVSLMWAGVLITNAGLVLWLLLTSSLKAFVLERTGISWSLTIAAIAFSIIGFTTTMRRDGIKVQWGA